MDNMNVSVGKKNSSTTNSSVKLQGLLFHNALIFTHTNAFLTFQQSLIHLKVCKKLRKNWFEHTRSINVPSRKFNDEALEYFLLNCENICTIDLTQCQLLKTFPQVNENNIHPNLTVVKLASTCVSMESLEQYFDFAKYPTKFVKLKTIDIRGTPALTSFSLRSLNINLNIGMFHRAVDSLLNLQHLLSYIQSNIEIFQNKCNLKNYDKEHNYSKLYILILSSLCNIYRNDQKNCKTSIVDSTTLSIALLLHVPVRTVGGSADNPEQQLILTTASANSYVPIKVLQTL